MSDLALALRQVRYENLAFWRNPPAAFFTIAFPLMFLVVINLAFGDQEVRLPGGTTRYSTLVIPSVIAFSVITACFTNIALNLAFAREQGVLKRIRGTPLPAWAFLFGRVVHAIALAAGLVFVTVAAGALLYEVEVPTATLPALLVTLVVGAGSFCALGAAMTVLIPNADSAPAIVNFTILPLLFVSNVFIRITEPPAWLDAVRSIFPVWHLVAALEAAFDPFTTGAGFRPAALAIMAAWGAGGVAVAVRFFSWEPRR